VTRTELLARADRLRLGRTPYVLATVVRAERPTSAKAGDCALVLPDGTMEGFVGGTCAESTVRLHGLRLIETGESTLLRITPSGADSAASAEGMVTVGNPCLSGGTLEIFLEAVIPPRLAYAFGDSPVARALAAVGTAAGYEVTLAGDPDVPIPPGADAVVVASHGRHEEALLAAALRAGVRYVALVASRRRGAAVLAGLDVAAEDKARVHTPAGLDIGARTAPEIALSVFAEILASRPPRAQAAEAGVAEPGVAEAARAEPGVAEPAAAESGVLEAVDPVCGMAVAVAEASLTAERDGRTFWFCSEHCRAAFLRDPTGYPDPAG
jgi:xanthine dehydrogenase accessory factor